MLQQSTESVPRSVNTELIGGTESVPRSVNTELIGGVVGTVLATMSILLLSTFFFTTQVTSNQVLDESS